MPGEHNSEETREAGATATARSKRTATDVRQPRTVDLRHRAPETATIAEGIRTLYG